MAGWTEWIRIVLVAGMAAASAACARPPPPPVPSAPPPPAPAEVVPPEPPPCARVVAIEVYKDARTLLAHCERGAVVRMTVALGRDPSGPKRERGDLRTPEGHYRITGPARPSRFHRFVPIDYPSSRDVEVAWIEGRLSEPDRARILRAHARGEAPPADTPLGGEMGFHGEGRRWRGESAALDWTYGCIAMSDAEIDYLIERLETGTPVTILP